MKKVILVLMLGLISTLGYSQWSSRYRVQNITKFGWVNKTVPVKAYSDSTWDAILFKEDLPNFGSGFWSLAGNAVASNTTFIGTTDNRSLTFKTNNAFTAKMDSLGNSYFYGNVISGVSTNSIGLNMGVYKSAGTAFIGARSTDPNAYAALSLSNNDGANFYVNYFTGSTRPTSGLIKPNSVIFEAGATQMTFMNDNAASTILFANLTTGVSGERMIIGSNGNIGISGAQGVKTSTAPLALLKIASGNTSFAPFSLTSGALTTGGGIIAGNVEFLTDDYYVTITTGTARQKVGRVLSATGTLDFPSTNAQLSADLTIALVGASVGDAVSVGTPAAPDANSAITAFVSATDVVTVRFNNYSAGAINPASANYKVVVIKN